MTRIIRCALPIRLRIFAPTIQTIPIPFFYFLPRITVIPVVVSVIPTIITIVIIIVSALVTAVVAIIISIIAAVVTIIPTIILIPIMTLLFPLIITALLPLIVAWSALRKTDHTHRSSNDGSQRQRANDFLYSVHKIFQSFTNCFPCFTNANRQGSRRSTVFLCAK